MAIVIIGITLSQIYDLGLTLAQEGENTQLLVDKMYYLRKDSEYAFWEAAKSDKSTRLKAVGNWVNTTEMGQNTIAKAAWKGKTHSATLVFDSIIVPDGCNPRCSQDIADQIVDDNTVKSRQGCLKISSKDLGIQAVGASFYLENPRAASMFMATNQECVYPG